MSSQPHEIEHRWGERVPVNIPVHVAIQSSAGISGRIRNLSLSGALIKTDSELRLHSLVQVTIVSSTWPQPAPLAAYVTRKRDEEVGIEWCDFAHRTVKEILRSPAIQAAKRSPQRIAEEVDSHKAA